MKSWKGSAPAVLFSMMIHFITHNKKCFVVDEIDTIPDWLRHCHWCNSRHLTNHKCGIHNTNSASNWSILYYSGQYGLVCIVHNTLCMMWHYNILKTLWQAATWYTSSSPCYCRKINCIHRFQFYGLIFFSASYKLDIDVGIGSLGVCTNLKQWYGPRMLGQYQLFLVHKTPLPMSIFVLLLLYSEWHWQLLPQCTQRICTAMAQGTSLTAHVSMTYFQVYFTCCYITSIWWDAFWTLIDFAQNL